MGVMYLSAVPSFTAFSSSSKVTQLLIEKPFAEVLRKSVIIAPQPRPLPISSIRLLMYVPAEHSTDIEKQSPSKEPSEREYTVIFLASLSISMP